MAKHNYVDNKLLYESVRDWKESWLKAKKKNLPEPPLTEYIGEAILLICQNIAKKPNFSGYSYKDEMISDAVINVIKYISNFDPEVSNSPFSYISTIAHFAFIRRIKAEKKQTYIKFKLTERALEFAETNNEFSLEDIVNQQKNFDISEKDIRMFESKKRTKKKDKKNIEDFLGDEDGE